MNVTRTAIWRPTGFMVKRVGVYGDSNGPALFEFSDLNPERRFMQTMNPLDRLRVGLWFIWQAVR